MEIIEDSKTDEFRIQSVVISDDGRFIAINETLFDIEKRTKRILNLGKNYGPRIKLTNDFVYFIRDEESIVIEEIETGVEIHKVHPSDENFVESFLVDNGLLYSLNHAPLVIRIDNISTKKTILNLDMFKIWLCPFNPLNMVITPIDKGQIFCQCDNWFFVYDYKEEKVLNQFSVQIGDEFAVLDEHVQAINISSNKEFVAVGTITGDVHVFRILTGELVYLTNVGEGAIKAVHFDSDALHVFATSGNKFYKLNLHNKEVICSDLIFNLNPRIIQVSGNGKFLILVGENSIHFFDIDDLQECGTLVVSDDYECLFVNQHTQMFELSEKFNDNVAFTWYLNRMGCSIETLQEESKSGLFAGFLKYISE